MALNLVGNFSPVEHRGLQWLAKADGWVDEGTTVTRKSDKPFDLHIEGRIALKSVTGGQPVSCRFAAWFPLAAVRKFSEYDMVDVPHGDWSFIRDSGPANVWAIFNNCIEDARTHVQIRARHSSGPLKSVQVAFDGYDTGALSNPASTEELTAGSVRVEFRER